MHVRRINVGDVATVTDIEASTFSSWNSNQIHSELTRKNGVSLVAVASDKVVVAWCCGVQTGVDAELLKITVHSSMQRCGIAEMLLEDLCTFFSKQQVEQIFLEVRSQNYPALQLYDKLDWHTTGRRKNYYKEPVDDALLFVRRLNKMI